MRTFWKGLVLSGILVAVGTIPDPATRGNAAEAATWTAHDIRQLPDTAFASVEAAPDGKKVRHLPHHAADGKLDRPHLCSALGRLHQVKWVDPANAETARRHLEEHLTGLGRTPCTPAPPPAR